MENETQGVTPEAASAQAANPSAPQEGRPASIDLADFTKRLAAEMAGKPKEDSKAEGNPESAGQDTPPEDPEANPQQATDHSQETEGEAEAANQWPKSAVERVRKLKEQKNKFREEAEQLRTKISELEKSKTDPAPQAQAPTSNEPLGNITSLDALQKATEEAQSTLDHAVDLLERSHDDIDGVTEFLKSRGINIGVPEGQEWTPQDIRGWLRQIKTDAQQVLRAAPKRQEYLAKENQAVQYVEANFPTFADESSEDFKLAASVIKEFPELRKRPDWMVHAVVYAQGYKAMQAAKAGQPAKKATTTPVAPRMPGAPSSAPKPAERDELKEASAKLSGGKGALHDAESYARAAVRAVATR